MVSTDISTAYIGLGSNLDKPHQQIHQAIHALRDLPETRLVAISGLYLSKPLLPPSGFIAQSDFCNAVAKLETQLSPHALLDHLQRIEKAQGRERIQRWGPRTVDLDILMFDDLQLHDDRLTLPHPGMSQRVFVLYPLQEIEDSLEIPGHGMLTELVKHCPENGLRYLGTIEGYEA